MKKRQLIFLTSILTTLSVASPAIADNDPLTQKQLLSHPEVKGALSAIDAYVQGVQIYENVPSISVGIVHDQDLLWQKSYGYSNLESKEPANGDTLYSICSISKLFTAIGIMQLRDAGKLTLRDAVDDHLDWFNIQTLHKSGGPGTIESLLTHSSGLPRESDFPYWGGPDFPFPTRAQIIDRLSSQETLYPAETFFQYSNLALTLAGEIIQERSGQEYQNYINQKILEPIGLSDTRTYYPEDLFGKQMAIGYSGLHREGTRNPVEPFFTRGITAAAGFTSSVNDLAKFASWQFQLLAGGDEHVLRANTLREMHRVHWVDPDWTVTWGLGFNVRRADDVTIVGHGGGCPGYITQLILVPQKNIAVIALTNAGDGPAGSIAENIMKEISEAIENLTTTTTEHPPNFLMFEGNYESRPWGGEIAVRQWNDQLVVVDIPGGELNNSMTFLEYDDNNTFTRLTDSGERREPWVFELSENGKANRIFRHSDYMNRIE